MMKGFPPPKLVETWLLLANSNEPEQQEIKRHNNHKIHRYFGSMELAELYIEQSIENH
jgi:hypothetical protein